MPNINPIEEDFDPTTMKVIPYLVPSADRIVANDTEETYDEREALLLASSPEAQQRKKRADKAARNKQRISDIRDGFGGKAIPKTTQDSSKKEKMLEMSRIMSSSSQEERAAYVQPMAEQGTTISQSVREFLDSPGSPTLKLSSACRMVITGIIGRFTVYRERITDPKLTSRTYLRERSSAKFLDMNNKEQVDDLLTEFGLILTSTNLKAVHAHVDQYARQHGTEVDVYTSYHFDQTARTLFVSLNETEMLQLSSDSEHVVPSVTDTMILLNSGDPIKVDLEAIHNCKLGMRVEEGSLMYSAFEATYSAEKMPAAHVRQLLCSRIISLFFGDMMEDKPLLVIDGEPGCGKTTLAKKIGWTMVGSRFSVSSLGKKREDMEVLLTTDSLVVLDNLDTPSQVRAYTDLLCQCATGGSITIRKLYQNNVRLSYPLVSSLVMTSTDTSWMRDTLASRALLIDLLPRERNGLVSTGDDNAASTKPLKTQVLESRDALMTEMMGRCRNILEALKNSEDVIAPKFSRLEEFGSLIWRCSLHEDWTDLASSILLSLSDSQREEADNNNPLLGVIDMMIGMHTDHHNEKMTATVLSKRLRDAAELLGLKLEIETGYFGTVKSLMKQKSALEASYGSNVERDSHTKNNVYSFHPTRDVYERCLTDAKKIASAMVAFNSHEMEGYL